jgi:hypothetical protein
MLTHNLRTFPRSQQTISTIKDLDELFDKWIGIQKDDYIVSIEEIFCYVSLEFAQQYYLKHLMRDNIPENREYMFKPIEHIPGIYKVTAMYIKCTE